MPYRKCPECKNDGRLLDRISKDALVEYYRCDKCGCIWTHDKKDHDLSQRVTFRPEPQKHD